MGIQSGMDSRQQRGQALPLTLVMLVVLCIGLLLTFNTGQIVNKKVELTNAADAAAYSLAVEQARAWNAAAYLNRGRIANEVAVAQLISLNSWLTQTNVTMKNMTTISNILSAVPYAGIVFRILARVFNMADRLLRQVRTATRQSSQRAIQFLDRLNGFYASAASTLIVTSATPAAIETARDVARANSPNAALTAGSITLLTAQLARGKSRFLTRHQIRSGRPSSNGGERFRNLVMESRDGFTTNREAETSFLGVMGFRAEGGTDMVDYDRWVALDTQQFFIDWDLFLFEIEFDVPVGWAGAQAVYRMQNQRFLPGINNNRGWYSDHRRRHYGVYGGMDRWDETTRLAANDPVSRLINGRRRQAYYTGYRGLRQRPYYDVNCGRMRSGKCRGNGGYARNAALPGDDDTSGPVYTVELKVAKADARTSSEVGIGAGDMQLRETPQHDEMRAMASAQVYFNRPHDNASFARRIFGHRRLRGTTDNKFEMGSLFSPYWQARLVETPGSARAALGAGSLIP